MRAEGLVGGGGEGEVTECCIVAAIDALLAMMCM